MCIRDRDTPAHREAVENGDLFTNDWVLDPAIKGEIPQKLIDKVKASGIDLSFMKAEDQALIRENTIDFLGQNAYSRLLVKPYVSGETCATVNNAGNNDGSGKAAKEGKTVKGWFESDTDPRVPLNPWGREIYPQCIYNLSLIHSSSKAVSQTRSGRTCMRSTEFICFCMVPARSRRSAPVIITS